MNNHTILYKNHGDTIGSWEAWTDGEMVHIRSYKKLGGNPTTSCYAAKGKNIGKANETTPAEQAALEVASKARLKLDKGYVKLKAEAQAPATNTLGLLRPMLATPIDKVKPDKIDWNMAAVQPKLDGHRALYKDGVLYSRQGKELDLLHVKSAIEESGLQDFHLDGELYIHGHSLQDLSRLIKRYREKSLALEYHIYDWVCDLPYMERIGILAEHRRQKGWDPVLQPVQTTIVTGMQEVNSWHEYYRKQGYEGTMLRHGTTPYRDGKRCQSLLKIKEFHDDEFVVIGFEEGKPYVKDEGTFQVPVWICETATGENFSVTAEGDMYAKHAQFLRAHDFIGRHLTVKYHYLSKDGIPQLPVALRWREDV